MGCMNCGTEGAELSPTCSNCRHTQEAKEAAEKLAFSFANQYDDPGTTAHDSAKEGYLAGWNDCAANKEVAASDRREIKKLKDIIAAKNFLLATSKSDATELEQAMVERDRYKIALEDIHSTVGQIRASQLPIDKVLKLAVLDCMMFAENALNPENEHNKE